MYEYTHTVYVTRMYLCVRSIVFAWNCTVAKGPWMVGGQRQSLKSPSDGSICFRIRRCLDGRGVRQPFKTIGLRCDWTGGSGPGPPTVTGGGGGWIDKRARTDGWSAMLLAGSSYVYSVRSTEFPSRVHTCIRVEVTDGGFLHIFFTFPLSSLGEQVTNSLRKSMRKQQ